MTVVVDFTELGGDVVIRCAPGRTDTGIDALTDAGFDVEGTQRWGTAFVCRIEGRPAADEELAVKGNNDYREQCVETPPNEAFWAYSYADNGEDWTYSSQGASSHQAIEGGFEGWRFVLNGGSTDPAVAATRPGSETGDEPDEKPDKPERDRPQKPRTDEPPRPDPDPDPTPEPTPDEPASSNPTPEQPEAPEQTPEPDEPEPTESGGDGPKRDEPGKGGGAGKPGKPKPDDKPQAQPEEQPDTDLGTTEEGATVTGELPEEPQATAQQDATSPTATLIGMGVIGLLGIGAGVTAYRRRARRT